MTKAQDIILIVSISLLALVTVVYAAPVAGQAGVATLSGANAEILNCQSGYYLPAVLTGNACVACLGGSYTAATNTATGCTSCQAGNYCPTPAAATAGQATTGTAKTACAAGYYCAAGVASQTSCIAGSYCAAGVAAGTACGAGYYCPTGTTTQASCAAGNYCSDAATQTTCPMGHICAAGVTAATKCGANTFQGATGKSLAADCAAFTLTTSAITGCRVYNQNTAGAACVLAEDGYFLGAAAPTTNVTPCLTNCAVCTAALYAGCTTAGPGYFQDAATSALVACAAGCKTCTAAAAASCTAAKAGFYLATGTATACAAGKGAPDGNTGDATTCVDCNAAATGLCGNCTAQGNCTTCQPGNVLTAATSTVAGACAAFSGTAHVTCKVAEGTTDGDCNSCDATQFRKMEQETVAPATTATDKPKGKCMCMDGYAEEATVVAACKVCGDNVKTCTFNATGVETITACKDTFHKVGTQCVAGKLPATDATIAGHFWDTTTSKYLACNTSCKTCTGAAATNCATCPDRASTWVEPTAAATNFNTYLKAITVINNTCFSDCPSGFTANSVKTDCAKGDAAAGSSSGVFALLSLILCFFLYI